MTQDEYFYKKMYYIREFETNLLKLFDEGILSGTTHAYIGQEADAVGIIENLNNEDHIFSNHRCHGHYLALTGDGFGLLTEIMGKKSGITRGIGGSQHIGTMNFKTNGIQGGILPAAAGIAFAYKLKREIGKISAVFIGDGTFGEGIVYETLNIASLWKLPLLIVVENNYWAQSTPHNLNLAGNIDARLLSFDIPTVHLTTTDVKIIYENSKKEINILRNIGGPRAIVIDTYRFCAHSKNDDARPKEEIEARKIYDPLLIQGKRLNSERKMEIELSVKKEIENIIQKARNEV